MKKIFLFFFLTIFSFVSYAQIVKFKTESILEGKAEIQVPEYFTLLKEEYRLKKYPGKNAPKVVYSNEETTINIGIGNSVGEATQADLPDFLKALEMNVKDKAESTGDWKGSGIIKSNGRDIGFVEFVSTAIDTKIYNLIFFTDVAGQLYVFTFNATYGFYESWKDNAKHIMLSLKVKS